MYRKHNMIHNIIMKSWKGGFYTFGTVIIHFKFQHNIKILNFGAPVSYIS